MHEGRRKDLEMKRIKLNAGEVIGSIVMLSAIVVGIVAVFIIGGMM